MRKSAVLLPFLLMSLISFGQHDDHAGHNHGSLNSPVPSDSEVIMLKETEFDFGKIPQGKPVTHIFDVSNIGSAPFKISNVQASCGCTTPEWERDNELLPGTSTKITVGYNAAAEGQFTKFITVYYGDNKTKQLTIKGEVWKTPSSSAPENNALDDLKNR